MGKNALETSRERAGSGQRVFRAEHVGSFLRPEGLVEARRKRQAGDISADELRAVEDAAIRDVVRRQEDAGIHAVTDGDYRRQSFHIDFLTSMKGIERKPSHFQQSFKGGPSEGHSPAVFAVTDRVAHDHDIAVDDFRFLAGVTSQTGKVTLPAPSFAHCRGGRDAIDRGAYPELGPFFDDLAAAYRKEIGALAEAGCRYVQLDEVHYTFLCDPALVAGFRARGDDPDELGRIYAKLINDSIAGRPADMRIGVHLCRGNQRSSWVAQGGYEPVAELLFNGIDADAFFLEYDSERAGGFEPLRFVPKGKTVVLGIVTSKSGELESPDLVKRRIDEAARYVPIEQLALSPQCGFASSVPGNKISQDDQWKKMQLVANVARDVWGTT